MKKDDEVIKQLESISPGQTIATIDSSEIANEGGILNCITWNIKRSNIKD
jgi:agmatine deiminase